MCFSIYEPLKFTLKSAQNAKLAVNQTLRWNKGSIIFTTGGAPGIWGDHMNFGRQKGGTEEFLVP